jgi:hypothetical protein
LKVFLSKIYQLNFILKLCRELILLKIASDR